MSFMYMQEMGRQLMGIGWHEPPDKHNLSPETEASCLLAAILDRLDGIYYEMKAEKQRQIEADAEADADAIPWWVIAHRYETAISPDEIKTMSARARRALAFLGCKDWSEVDEDLVRGVRNCGDVTTAEIMAFKNAKLRGGAA